MLMAACDLVNYFGNIATQRSDDAAIRAEGTLSGRTHYRHGNGGVTVKGKYHPPEPRPPGYEDDDPSKFLSPSLTDQA